MFVVVVAAEAVVNGVGAPFSTTPQLAPPRKGATCHEQEHRIQLSFGGRWSNSFDQGARRKNLPKNLSHRLKRFVIGLAMQIEMKADGLTV